MENNDFEFVQDTMISNDFQEEWSKIASDYGYWADRYANELKVKDLIWLEKKVLKAKLFLAAKAKTDAAGKPYTDKGADAEVHSNPKYEDVSKRLVEAEWRVNKCSEAKWAFNNKYQSLEQLTKDRDRAMSMPDGYKSNKSTAAAGAQQREALNKSPRLMRRKEGA